MRIPGRLLGGVGQAMKSFALGLLGVSIVVAGVFEAMPAAARISFSASGVFLLLAASWHWGPRRLVRGLASAKASWACAVAASPCLLASVQFGAFGKSDGLLIPLLPFFVMSAGATFATFREAVNGVRRIGTAGHFGLTPRYHVLGGLVARGEVEGFQVEAITTESTCEIGIAGVPRDLVIEPARLADLRQRIQAENVTTGHEELDAAVHLRAEDPAGLLARLDHDGRDLLRAALARGARVRGGRISTRLDAGKSGDAAPALLALAKRLTHELSRDEVLGLLARQAREEVIPSSRIARLRALSRCAPGVAREALAFALASDDSAAVRAAAAELVLADDGAPAALRSAATGERLRQSGADGRLALSGTPASAGALSEPAATGAVSVPPKKQPQ